MQSLKRKIVVLAGYGEFSRRVATDIAALPQAECVLGLPPGSRATAFAAQVGVPFMLLDSDDSASLRRLLEGAFAAVNVRGPFVAREHLAIATRCAALGVHYIDPGESREYFSEFARLHRVASEHDALLVTGAGAAPGVSSVLAGLLTEKFDRAGAIHLFFSPGVGDRRELANTRAVLARAVATRHNNNGRRRRDWWERAQTVRLPSPIGRRRGYPCELPDIELLARHFGVNTVSAHAGFAPGMLNWMLAMAAFMCRRGWVEQLSPFGALLMRAAASATRADSTAAIRVAMRGTHGGVEDEHIASLIARGDAGPAIAAAPIMALLRKWLDQGVREAGAVPCVGLLDFDELKAELAQHNVVLLRQ